MSALLVDVYCIDIKTWYIYILLCKMSLANIYVEIYGHL